MKNLSILVKKFREDRNLTQAELAKKAGIGSGTLGDIERGVNKSTIKTITKLSKALDLSETENDILISAFVGKDVVSNDPRAKNLNSREKKQYDSFMEDTVMYFNDETISFEDKEKFFNSLQDAFFEIKIANKRKK